MLLHVSESIDFTSMFSKTLLKRGYSLSKEFAPNGANSFQ